VSAASAVVTVVNAHVRCDRTSHVVYNGVDEVYTANSSEAL